MEATLQVENEVGAIYYVHAEDLNISCFNIVKNFEGTLQQQFSAFSALAFYDVYLEFLKFSLLLSCQVMAC